MPRPAPARTYKIDEGLAEVLELALGHQLPKAVQRWAEELSNGEISEQARQVFVALDWMTYRDPRVRATDGRPAAATLRPARRRSPGQSELPKGAAVTEDPKGPPPDESALVAGE